MVIAADAETEVSVTEVAVSVTVAGFGTAAGAVYVMLAPEALVVLERVPQLMPLQPEPDRVQLTPLFLGSF